MSNNITSLAKKMVLLMGECTKIKKDKKHGQGYTYASCTVILNKINEALVKHGVCSFSKSEQIPNGQEKFFIVKNTIILVDAESGESMEISGIGGGKSVEAAQTLALKYAWLTTLNISAGEDPEADNNKDKSRSPAQYKRSSFVQDDHSSFVQDERSSQVHFWIERFRGVKNQDEFNSAKAELNLVYSRMSTEEKKRINDAAMVSKSKLVEGSN